MGSRGHVALVLVAITAALVACGDDDEKSYGDAKIRDKLNLEEVKVDGHDELTIAGDTFCIVKRNLLNTRSEVEDAIDDDKISIVIASREGNVGIAADVLVNDCAEAVRKKLNELDPEPKD